MILKIEEVAELEVAGKMSKEAFGLYFGHFQAGSNLSRSNPDGSFTFPINEENFKVSLVADGDLADDTLYVSTCIKERYFRDTDNINIPKSNHPLISMEHED